ncbi:FAD-binding monooxygenase-like protein [Mycena olivaceomarginata]|nr:FAD-binding monooxygenase-like protein [Mycena olivaceomarginata]
MTSQEKLPVLIVGGGVVGLSASLSLSHHKIHSLLVECRPGASIHPRARSVNARTMEVFRHLGVESLGIYSGHSLREVIETQPRTEGDRTFPLTGLLGSISPTTGAFVTQDMLQPVLADAARARGGEVRFSTECVSVEQDSEGVTATLRDRESGMTETVRAAYLIAADGAKSPIRTQLDVPVTGRGTMGYLLNILFHADLKPLVYQREFSICIVDRPEVCGLFTSINNTDRWVFHLSYDPSKGEQPSDFPPEKCKELLLLALGMPEIDIRIESILPWEPSVRIAERLQHGRIFLAGDAAHQMPPWGGQGANSGIADAYNLAWKLAAVLDGRAGNALLETYDVERLPAGREAAEASASGADERGMISVKKNLTVARGMLRKAMLISGHGYGYTSPSICEEDTFPLGGVTWRPWTLPSLFLSIDGRPGRRAPHVWGCFTVTDWLGAAKEVSSTLGIEVAAYCAILVRPDDFVLELERAVRQALCLQ